jgi:hypothetical protein
VDVITIRDGTVKTFQDENAYAFTSCVASATLVKSVRSSIFIGELPESRVNGGAFSGD